MAAFTLACLASPAASEVANAMSFFEGRTESIGTVKLVMKKQYVSKAIGNGEFRQDGSLILVQRVQDDGAPPKVRRWHMRQIGPGHYSGTMTEAKGPVTVEEIAGKFRFRFKMDGNVSVEQWLIPSADGRSAQSKMTFKKFGLRVGSSIGTIRRLD